MRVVIQQVDLDTALTAYLLGVTPADSVTIARGQAPAEDLADPTVCCIEAGGSGQVEYNNFDHHNTTEPLPPACVQALRFKGEATAWRGRLVEYVSALDEGRMETLGPSPGFPTLSAVFSGMRLTLRDPSAQLAAGLSILGTLEEMGLDPFGVMPQRPEWQSYLEARQREDEGMAEAGARAEVWVSKGGQILGFLETGFIGALRALYARGCAVAIAYAPAFGEPPVRKYTIGGNGVRVDHLLPILNALEPGWGGPSHGTIIGSPRSGSGLEPGVVRRIVEDYT